MSADHLVKMASDLGVKIPGVDLANPKDLLAFVESLVAAESSMSSEEDSPMPRPLPVVAGRGRGRGRPPGSGRGRGRPPLSTRIPVASRPCPVPSESSENEVKPEVVEVISDDAARRVEALVERVSATEDSDNEAEVQEMLAQAQSIVEAAVADKSDDDE